MHFSTGVMEQRNHNVDRIILMKLSGGAIKFFARHQKIVTASFKQSVIV